MRADIHDGQENKRSMQGPDTEAQDHPPFVQIRLATHGRSMNGLMRHKRSDSDSFDHLGGGSQDQLRLSPGAFATPSGTSTVARAPILHRGNRYPMV
jgi:hypothetical protein